MLTGREIILGISGGVAAYKSAELASRLVQENALVTVAMTAAACQFVGPATFSALTGRPVAAEVFDGSAYPLGAHIELAARGELLCIAPATADFLARAALGLADDLLSTLHLSFEGPVLFAPAMNNAMWEKPSVQRNVAALAADGAKFVGPDVGWLSCRKTGPGRMASPEAIFRAIAQEFANQRPESSGG